MLHSARPTLLALFAALVALVLPASAGAVTGQEAVDRAQQWVNAGMPYCQVPYGHCDSHVCCGSGYRPENPAWDAYRSDCSGLVSFAWGIGGPGRVTWQMAPFENDITHVIDWSQLEPGDALNSQEHVMLFAGWKVYGSVLTVVEEYDWGHAARRKDFNVHVSGSTVTRTDWTSNPFTAIRYNGIQASCSAHCEGTQMVGADCGKSDCAPYGATCADDSLGLRCVSVYCPATGSAQVCLPDGHTLGACSSGHLDTSDCAASGSVCSDEGGAHCLPQYDAKLVAKGSNVMADADGVADYRLCAGEPLELTFELENQGHLAWSDDGSGPGQAIRLGTSDGKTSDFADPLFGASRFSVSLDENPDVVRGGPDCDDQAGCRRTVFKLSGPAPAEPGIYTGSYRLVDEARTWFGPVVSTTVHVAACTLGAPPQAPQPDPVGSAGAGGRRGAPDPVEETSGDKDAGGSCSVSPGELGGHPAGAVSLAIFGAAVVVLRRRRRG